MKYFGCIFVIVGVVFLSREYLAVRKKRIEVQSELLLLVTHLHREICVCVCSPAAAVLRFESPILSKCGFIERVRGGESLSRAFSSVEDSLGLPQKSREYIASLFHSVATGGYKEECIRLERAKAEIEKLIKAENEEFARLTNLTPTLTAVFAIGFVLLVI